MPQTHSNSNVNEDVKVICEIEKQKLIDWASRELTAILNHYEPDATVIVPNALPARGHEAIAQLLRRPLADPNFQLSFRSQHVEIAANGDLAYSVGTFEDCLSAPDRQSTTASTGHYVWIYRKQSDGNWLVATEISVRGPTS